MLKLSLAGRLSSFTNRWRSDQGVSLIEVLIAITILSIALTAMITLGSVGLNNSAVSRNQTTADRFAREGLEMLRSYRDNQGWPAFRRLGNFSSNHPIWGANYGGTAAPSCVVTNADRYYFAFLLPAHGVATPVTTGVRAVACGSEATFANPSTYQHRWLNDFCQTSVWLTEPPANPTIRQAEIIPNYYRVAIVGYETADKAFVRSVVCYYEGENIRSVQLDGNLTNWQ